MVEIRAHARRPLDNLEGCTTISTSEPGLPLQSPHVFLFDAGSAIARSGATFRPESRIVRSLKNHGI